MGKSPELKTEDQEKSDEELAQLPIYGFILSEFELWDKLYDIVFSVNHIVGKIKSSYSMLGDIDKKKNWQKIELLKKEEGAILDKLTEKINQSIGFNNIPNYRDLFFAYVLAAERHANKTNNDEAKKDEEDEELEENDAATIESEDDYDDTIPDIPHLLRTRSLEIEKVKMQKNIPQKSDFEIEAILTNEHDRLKSVRQMLESPSKNNSDQNAFDPQKELLALSRRSSRNPQDEKEDLPRNSKKESLKKYKSELVAQILGMAKLNAFLENAISQNEATDLDSLYREFELKAKELKLTDWQIERYQGTFNAFKEAIKQNDQEWEEYKDLTGQEIIKRISDYTCKGEVEVEKRPFANVFIISDDTDFIRIHQQNYQDDELSAHDYDLMKNCRGFHKMGSIFIRKSETTDLQNKKELLNHELKHRLNELISNGAYDDEYDWQPDHLENINSYFKDKLDFALIKAKDEILAYFKDGEDVDQILGRLTNEEIYAFREDSEEEEELDKYAPKEIKRKISECKEKYEYIITEGLAVLDIFEGWGFSRKEIIGLFQMQKIPNWIKIYRRLSRDSKFMEERNKKSDEKIKQLEENLQQHSETISWLKRNLFKLVTKLPVSLTDFINNKIQRESLLGMYLYLAELKKEKLDCDQEIHKH